MNERTGFDPQRLSEGFTGQEHLLGLVARSQTRQDWVEEVAAQTERQSAIFVELINKCPFGIYIVGDDMRIVAMNERSQNGAFRNVRPVIGRLFREAMDILWPAATAQKIVGHFAETLATGRPYYSREFVAPRADTGELEGYEWELQRTKLPGGRLGVICFYFDSTELRTAQRALEESATRQQLLIEELNHRVKNTLMVVQAMALQSFGRDVAADKRDAFQSRLQALAKAHDTLDQGQLGLGQPVGGGCRRPGRVRHDASHQGWWAASVDAAANCGFDRDGAARALHQRDQVWRAFRRRRTG
ncbi:hypothetical protein J2792_002942 [Novosphingobium capsulatum]|uniref:histidine kinase n=1 Tax=Novosphingobium capsulatum TaxID=13688 RepID=A0ABU1MPB8_9SPHN|nr:HWE histidine kinase domain-containing protein [Novosphingobium capsulatum]MDR6512059.1 hypothetical protein [Novosphingobium capsulatum]